MAHIRTSPLAHAQLGVSRISLDTCSCRLAATQLVEIGLFPCAPYRPTLAVDINVLDFARLLFLNISPNVTAWCKATEAFLMARSHKINYSVSGPLQQTICSLTRYRTTCGNDLAMPYCGIPTSTTPSQSTSTAFWHWRDGHAAVSAHMLSKPVSPTAKKATSRPRRLRPANPPLCIFAAVVGAALRPHLGDRRASTAASRPRPPRRMRPHPQAASGDGEDVRGRRQRVLRLQIETGRRRPLHLALAPRRSGASQLSYRPTVRRPPPLAATGAAVMRAAAVAPWTMRRLLMR